MYLVKDALREPLYVITAVVNPCRYKSRWELYRNFAKHVNDAGAHLITVEAAFGERDYAVTRSDNSNHIRVRTRHELWLKENLINIGIQHLPSDWEYVAWVDADLTFVQHGWVSETLHQLQHYDIVQMFSEAHDLDPHGHPFNRYRGFCWSQIEGVKRKRSKAGSVGYPYPPYGADKQPGSPAGIVFWHHPGFAWAIRRSAYELLGGLIDFAVVGESDYIMAKALVGEAEDVLYPGVSANYRAWILEWQRRALVHVRKNIGYVGGLITHHWHGPKSKRNYWERCKVLVNTQFDPIQHLRKDSQGLWQLVDRGDENSLLLRDGLRRYFRNRDEDATSMVDN